MDPDQTAPIGSSLISVHNVCLYAYANFSDAVILLAFQGLNNVFCICTEIMAQDDTVTLE